MRRGACQDKTATATPAAVAPTSYARRVVALALIAFALSMGAGWRRITGRLDADALDEAPGRLSHLLAEDPREVARAHRDASGERVDRVVGLRMLHDPGLQVAQRVPLGHLAGELRRELGLTARPLEEEHHRAGDLEGQLAIDVVLDEGEREVHPGGDPRGGPDVPVAHVDRVGLDLEPRVAGREGCGVGPVGRDAATVEQARAREQERPGADRADPAGPGRRRPHVGEQPLVVDGRPRADAPRDDQRVEGCRTVVVVAVDPEHEARRGAHRAHLGSDDLDLVAGPPATAALGDPGAREHLERPDHVEQLDVGEGDHRDPPRRARRIGRGMQMTSARDHADTIAPDGGVRNDAYPSDPDSSGGPEG